MKLKKKLIIPVIGAYPDIGKGFFSASTGYLLKKAGLKVGILKFDGYFNTNSGNMNPHHKSSDYIYSNEEIYVLKDGYETDADHGYYERFLNEELDSSTCMTNGSLFNELLEKIKKNQFKFGEVLKYKHYRDLVKEKIKWQIRDKDVLVFEIGGTIGDDETLQLYLALQEMKNTEKYDFNVVMLSPYISEDKINGRIELSSRTKITRKSFLEASKIGLNPNTIILRNNCNLLNNDIEYICTDCNLNKRAIFSDPQVSEIYELPKILESQKLINHILKSKKIKISSGRIEKYLLKKRKIKERSHNSINIGIFGKTMSNESYITLIESIEHASVEYGTKVKIIWLDDMKQVNLSGIQGIIIGESISKIKDKIKVIKYARKNDIQLLAISFGWDLKIKEFVENEIKSKISLNEFERPSKLNINKIQLKLGNHRINLHGTIKNIYRSNFAIERNRNQSRVSEDIVKIIEKNFEICRCDTEEPVIFKMRDHPFFIGVKFHPEYKSRPGKAHPLIKQLIKIAASKNNISPKLI